jgi:hypothetical protein
MLYKLIKNPSTNSWLYTYMINKNKLYFMCFFLHPLSHSLSLPPLLFLLIPISSTSARTCMWVRADPRTRASVCADSRTRACVRAYITPVRIPLFCSFSTLPLVGVVGFAWQRPFRLAKGEGVTSILRGIPLHFLHCRNSRVVFTLLMLVYLVMQVFM